MNIAIYGRSFGEQHARYVEHLLNRLVDAFENVTVYEPFFSYMETQITVPTNVHTYSAFTDLEGQIDFMVSVGGDGTFLDSTTFVRSTGVPILGVNTGRLGFLSHVSLNEIDEAVDALSDGEFELDNRAVLGLHTQNKLFGDVNFALNELTVHKKDSASMITIHTYLDNEYLNSYWADGLIVATPTGSTAYSLSCGGPIVTPGSRNFVITPIAPHNLNVRPIVVPDDKTLTLRMEGRTKQYLIALDSRSASVDETIELKVSRQNFDINMVRLRGRNFLSTLRGKLSWGLDRRN